MDDFDILNQLITQVDYQTGGIKVSTDLTEWRLNVVLGRNRRLRNHDHRHLDRCSVKKKYPRFERNVTIHLIIRLNKLDIMNHGGMKTLDNHHLNSLIIKDLTWDSDHLIFLFREMRHLHLEVCRENFYVLRNTSLVS
jgi:hypothetical protein